MKKTFILGTVTGLLLGIVLTIAAFFYYAKVFLPNQIEKELIAPIASSYLPSDSLAFDYNFKLYSLEDTNKVIMDFSNLKGKVLFLNFWENWCTPCIAEMPSISKLYEITKTQDIQYAIISTQSSLKAKKIADKYNLPAFHFKGKLPSFLDGMTIPRTYIVNKSGFIVLKSESAKWDDSEVISLIKKLTSE